MPEALLVLVDQPSWTHCQTWLFQHRTIALHQALRLHHGPHWGSFTMGCIREANNLPHSLKLNQSGTPSDTIFRVALYLPLILKLEWKRRITVIKMTAWHGSIRTRPPWKLGVKTVPFAFSSTHRSSFCLLSSFCHCCCVIVINPTSTNSSACPCSLVAFIKPSHHSSINNLNNKQGTTPHTMRVWLSWTPAFWNRKAWLMGTR